MNREYANMHSWTCPLSQHPTNPSPGVPNQHNGFLHQYGCTLAWSVSGWHPLACVSQSLSHSFHSSAFMGPSCKKGLKLSRTDLKVTYDCAKGLELYINGICLCNCSHMPNHMLTLRTASHLWCLWWWSGIWRLCPSTRPEIEISTTSIIKIPDNRQKHTQFFWYTAFVEASQVQLALPLQACSGPQPTPAQDHTRWPMCRALGGLWITSECKGKASDLPDWLLNILYILALVLFFYKGRHTEKHKNMVL